MLAAIIVIVVIVLLIVFLISLYNGMVRARNKVDEAWSGIDVQLKRRHDLIPNLVETVKGYAKHEESVFADIANARAGLLSAKTPEGKMQANGQLDGALGRLLALSEAYPDLKANQNFLSLQDQLEGTENRIQVARRRYNETLRDYNTFIGQFPNSIWANFAGFHVNNAYFQASEASRTAPAVKF
jgi:LemA protein